MIGLGDRALKGEACVPWGWRTTALTPRVITLQNRMRLTQSPRRALIPTGQDLGLASEVLRRNHNKQRSAAKPGTRSCST